MIVTIRLENTETYDSRYDQTAEVSVERPADDLNIEEALNLIFDAVRGALAAYSYTASNIEDKLAGLHFDE